MSQSKTNTQDGIESKVEQSDPKPREIWTSPRPEIDKYGVPTGSQIVQCTDCGIESITTLTEFTSHREHCRFEKTQ